MEHSTKPKFSPYFVVFAGVVAVSTASIFIRLAQREAPSLVIAAYRLGIAAAILLPMAWLQARNEIRHFSRREYLLLLLAGFFLALHFASWISSLQYTSIASSVVLVTTTPLWVALASPLVLKERTSFGVIIGLIIALAGSAVVGASESCQLIKLPGPVPGFNCLSLQDTIRGEALWGNLLALVGAWCAAGYLLLGRRVRSSLSLLSYTFVVYGTAAAFLWIAVVITRQSPIGYSALTYICMLMLAVVPQLIGHSSFNWALRYLPAAFVAVTLLGEPIGSSLLATIFLQEIPTLMEVFGGGLILVGIYLVTRTEIRKHNLQQG